MPPKKAAKKAAKKSPATKPPVVKPPEKVWTVTVRDKKGPPDDIEVFFDVRDRSYFYKVANRYLSLGISELKMHLRAAGLSDNSKAGPYYNGQLEIDWPIYNAQMTRAVDYAGSLAGHRVGPYSDGSGRLFLVTDEARGVFDDMPKKFDDPEWFPEFVAELLPGEQASRLFYWLAIALRSLRNQDYQPGPFTVFAGPAECGKSLLQYVITEILGGRSASPMDYMLQETNFNKDLVGAEHWMIEEFKTSKDTRSRVALGVAMKECFNNQDFRPHGKGKDAGQPMTIFRRGTGSINDDPELLMHLPPLNSSNDDKLQLFKCERVTKALDRFRNKYGTPERALIAAHFKAEAANIRWWLLHNFKKVPAQWRNDRYGIAAYHHPTLREMLLSFTKENRLLSILDELLFSDEAPHNVKTGLASALEKEFRESKFNFEFQRIISYPGEFGRLLGLIEKIHPERITSKKIHGYAHWSIHPPSQQKQQD